MLRTGQRPRYGVQNADIGPGGIFNALDFMQDACGTGGIRWFISLGNKMRTLALLFAALLVASFSTSADAAKKKAAAAKPDPAIAAQQNTANLIRDAMNPGMVKAAPAAPAKKAKKAKKKGKKK